MLNGPVTPFAQAADHVVDGLVPTEIICPTDVEGLAAAIATAHRDRLAVIAWGGGTHMALGNRPFQYDVALRTSGLDRIRDHAPADLTLTTEVGVTLSAVQRLLGEHGQFLPLEAEEPERATIGGLLAAAVAGPLRLGHGTVRDRLLWSEVVTPDGTLVRAGAKVVKSVAGYDLPKLHLGALGGLGILAAACFKVQPLPASRRTVLLRFDASAPAAALAAVLSDAQLAPALLTLVHGPAAWGPPFDAGPWTLAVGADGAEIATAWQVERVLALASGHGATSVDVLEGDRSIEARQALMTYRGQGAVRLRLVVLPDRLASLLEWLETAAPQPLSLHVEAAAGVVRVAWCPQAIAGMPDAWAPACADQVQDTWRDAGAIAVGLGGHWLLEACPSLWKSNGLDVWGPPRPDRALMARLKRGLDPAGTLSPGRGIGG